MDRHKKTNKQKSEQLGMSFSMANHILRKQIIFHLMQKCGMDICYQCKEKIISVDDISIEHKQPWLYSRNPPEIFFDIENIAFSHVRCNIANRRGTANPNNRSGFKGVHYKGDKYKTKPWLAQISINNQTVDLGFFSDPVEAARVYDNAAIKHLGEAALTNKAMGRIQSPP